jgi:predicted house-cleaning noncanonical NTP pyrophosphatase (MazG superfamily)
VAGKLVRDKIPDVIRASGVEPRTRVADDAEYRRLLRDKLVEEVGEFLDSDDPAELADVFEVVLALAATLGVDCDGLEALRSRKLVERGGFGQRIVWLGNG